MPVHRSFIAQVRKQRRLLTPYSNVDPEFGFAGAKARIISSDGVAFGLTNAVLHQSWVLWDMVKLPMAEPADIHLTHPIIESSKIVRLMLKVIKTGRIPRGEDHNVGNLIHLAKKYGCDLVGAIARTHYVDLVGSFGSGTCGSRWAHVPLDTQQKTLRAVFVYAAKVNDLELATSTVRGLWNLQGVLKTEHKDSDSSKVVAQFDLAHWPVESVAVIPTAYLCAMIKIDSMSRVEDDFNAPLGFWNAVKAVQGSAVSLQCPPLMPALHSCDPESNGV